MTSQETPELPTLEPVRARPRPSKLGAAFGLRSVSA